MAERNGDVEPTAYTTNGPKTKLQGRAFYESIGSPKVILAPMVDQSEFVGHREPDLLGYCTDRSRPGACCLDRSCLKIQRLLY
jgi:hypothetical protein